jgi:predicted RNA methylase
MLQDEARVEAYRVALNSLSSEKVVIDVGAGTGILSLMAMDAGAKSVYALEYSSIAKEAEIAFSKRKERSKMMVFKGLAEEFSLGTLKADLIVSEWMGYFLINEHMLPSVLAIRDKWLKKEGMIIPQ